MLLWNSAKCKGKTMQTIVSMKAQNPRCTVFSCSAPVFFGRTWWFWFYHLLHGSKRYKSFLQQRCCVFMPCEMIPFVSSFNWINEPTGISCSGFQCLSKSCLNPLLVEILEQADFFVHRTLAFGDDVGVLAPHMCFAFWCGEFMLLAQV